MKVITKDHRQLDCKLIDFTHGNEDHENDVLIILSTDIVEFEEITNIAYIKY
jgi:hypothetical protein